MQRVIASVQKAMNTQMLQKLNVVLLHVRKTHTEILLLELAFVIMGLRLMITEIAYKKLARLVNNWMLKTIAFVKKVSSTVRHQRVACRFHQYVCLVSTSIKLQTNAMI